MVNSLPYFFHRLFTALLQDEMKIGEGSKGLKIVIAPDSRSLSL